MTVQISKGKNIALPFSLDLMIEFLSPLNFE